EQLLPPAPEPSRFRVPGSAFRVALRLPTTFRLQRTTRIRAVPSSFTQILFPITCALTRRASALANRLPFNGGASVLASRFPRRSRPLLRPELRQQALLRHPIRARFVLYISQAPRRRQQPDQT